MMWSAKVRITVELIMLLLLVGVTQFFFQGGVLDALGYTLIIPLLPIVMTLLWAKSGGGDLNVVGVILLTFTLPVVFLVVVYLPSARPGIGAMLVAIGNMLILLAIGMDWAWALWEPKEKSD